MNLRDKLRDRTDEVAEATPSNEEWNPPSLDEDDDTPAPKAKRASVMPKLDVNRRFMVLAGAAAFMTSLLGVMYINSSAAGLSEGGTKIEVQVLAEDVKPGQLLTEARLTTAEIPKAYLPTGYIEDLAKVKGKVAIAPMVKGEPIIAARISAPDAKHGIAYLLKKGERAKTIKVEADSGLAGLLKPGNEVDLMGIVEDPNNEGRQITMPLVQRARVIAVGQHLLGEIPKVDDEGTPREDTSGGIASDSTVTFAFPAAKIRVVALVEKRGGLQIALRGEGEKEIIKTPFSDDVIMALLAGKLPPKAAIKIAATTRPIIRRTVTYTAPRPVYRAPIVRSAPVRQAPRPRPVVVRQNPPAPRPVSKPPVSTGAPQVIRFGSGND